jgi:signal transduction histidine kinase
MRQVQKLESLGLMAGGIAHDFNNLLVGVLGNADLALGTVPADAPVAGFLRDIQTASQRAAELCRQMLAYSGRGRFSIGPLDLGALVGESVPLLRLSLPKSARLTLDLAPGETATLTKRQTIRDFSTRKHHPGVHRVELQVNGRRLAETTFTLRA